MADKHFEHKKMPSTLGLSPVAAPDMIENKAGHENAAPAPAAGQPPPLPSGAAREVAMPDFWNSAWEKVKQGDYRRYVARYERIILRQNQPDGKEDKGDPEPLEATCRARKMREILEKQTATLKQSRWGLLVSGRKFGVADTVEKIINSVLYAKDSIGKAVITAGEPHAALAWAGVCLLLPVSNILPFTPPS
jgi:hypothetical protein